MIELRNVGAARLQIRGGHLDSALRSAGFRFRDQLDVARDAVLGVQWVSLRLRRYVWRAGTELSLFSSLFFPSRLKWE